MMKAIALAVSARKRGNCYDFARYTLDRLQGSGVKTELVNFCDYRILPCQHCDYECLQKRDGISCPIDDDVRLIWEKTWASEILFLFLPNYGGLPPALWFAFSQRAQGFFREAPLAKLKRSVVSTVVLAAPHQSGGAPWIFSFVGDEVKNMDRKVVGFEVINPPQFKAEYTFDPLIGEAEIQRRLEFLTDRTLQAARELALPGE
jgi:multimeric flavodoxin WrbA